MAQKIDKKSKAKKSYSQKARLGSFPYNLVESGNLEKYYKLLTNFDFLTEKINHPEFGVQALIEDYDLIDAPEASTNPEYDSVKVKALKWIQGALRLSAHVLAKDKTQLAGQLWGRMQGFDVPEIQQLLSQAKQRKTTGLRPLTPSLTRPDGHLQYTLSRLSDSVNAVAVTANGLQAISASSDNTLNVWDLATGQLRLTLGRRNGWSRPHSGWVNAVAVTADGLQAISASSGKSLKLWDLATGQLRLTLKGHSGWVNAVAVTADGKRAISGSSDNTLKVWNLETAEELFTLIGHSSVVSAVAVTEDGKRAISGSWDNTLKVWNLETAEELFTLNGHSYSVHAVAVTEDGKRAISGSSDNTLKVWNLETAEELFTLNSHSDLVRAVAVTEDGKRAISGSWDNTLKLWNLQTGEVIASFTGESPILCCAVAPDGATIVAGEDSGQMHFLRVEGMEASP